ncbi:MAG TPA: ABC transporter ATP-binding protein [Acidimicrobiales bacterium]
MRPIRFDGASKWYGDDHLTVHALREVSLEVAAGELLAIMGPSGSGKSTLLKLAGGLDLPTKGRVTIEGADLVELSVAKRAELRRRRIGYVFQDRNLLPQLTAVENVALPLELDGVRPRRARRLAGAVLDELGLEGLVHRFPDDLSGGEQQRVAVARAVVGPRRILLADEPTASLDSLNGEAVAELLRRRCEAGATAVMVTHDASLAGFADRVAFLRDGRLADMAGPVSGPETLLAPPAGG